MAGWGRSLVAGEAAECIAGIGAIGLVSTVSGTVGV